MEFRFTNEFSPHKADEIVSFISGPRLWIPSADYPDFLEWAQRVHGELKRGSKRAMLALAGDDVVGVLVYQKHKKRADTLELKNLTIRPDARGRYIASFLMRNAEHEGARDFSAQRVVCDAKARNLPVRYFLTRHHYTAVARTDLYGLASGSDVVYSKNLHPLA